MKNINSFFGYSRTAQLNGKSVPNSFPDVLSKWNVGPNRLPSSKVSSTLTSLIEYVNEGNIAIGEITTGGNKVIAAEVFSAEEDLTYVGLRDVVTGDISISKIKDGDWEAVSTTPVTDLSITIFGLVLPSLLTDEEFSTDWDTVMTHLTSPSDSKVVEEALHRMSSNIYARTALEVDDSAKVKISYRNDSFSTVKKAAVMSGTLAPDTVLFNSFEVFQCTASTAGSATSEGGSTKATTTLKPSEMKGKYAYGSEVSEEYAAFVPTISDSIVVPKMIYQVAEIIQQSDVRNIGFVGPAGTGKTEGSIDLASFLGKPYWNKTCNANDEISDFLGLVMPITENIDSASLTEAERTLLNDVTDTGITRKSVCAALQLPTAEDVYYDTAAAMEALGFPGVTDSAQALQLWEQAISERIQQFINKVNSVSGNNGFKYVPTPFITAMKEGGVIELQEPNVIIQPGVLVGLNSLMEKGGQITLPTGELIKRHPDTVVIMTTNGDYEGCRSMNQALMDRLDIVYHIEGLSAEEMAGRVYAQTGFDMDKLKEMSEIIYDIADVMKTSGITDGTCGVRSLLNWAKVSKITNDIYNSCIITVISKLSADADSRDELKKRLDESSFAPKRRSRRK